MKANEAPEKLYVLHHEDYSDRRIFNAFTEKESNTDIEYIRKDAFIERACVKLKKLMYDNLMFQGKLHREQVIDNFVENFKKYIEG